MILERGAPDNLIPDSPLFFLVAVPCFTACRRLGLGPMSARADHLVNRLPTYYHYKTYYCHHLAIDNKVYLLPINITAASTINSSHIHITIIIEE